MVEKLNIEEEILRKVISTNLNNKEEVLTMLDRYSDYQKSNPLDDDGMAVFIDKNGYYTFIERPSQNGGRQLMLSTLPKFLEVANQSQEIIRERRKVAKLSFSAISGILPQSELVGCLGAYSEGLILDSSLSSPSFEGGQIFILVLRSTITDFAFKDEIIEDVGVPTTVLVVRTERVVKASTQDISMSNDISSSRQFFEVKSMFAACVKGRGRIDENTPMYFYPFSNSYHQDLGRICLGQVDGSDLLLFEKQTDLEELPRIFYSLMANTHELQAMFKSSGEISQRQLILRHKNKPFDEDQLIAMDLTYSEFIDAVVPRFYR